MRWDLTRWWLLLVILTGACSGSIGERYTPDQCWSTQTLRVRVGDVVADLPAASQPAVAPGTPGYRDVAYDKGLGGVHRLWACQDRAHVPLAVDTVHVSRLPVDVPGRPADGPPVINAALERWRPSGDLSQVTDDVIPVADLPLFRPTGRIDRVEGGTIVRHFANGRRRLFFRCSTTPLVDWPDPWLGCTVLFRTSRTVRVWALFRGNRMAPGHYPAFLRAALQPRLRP